MLGVPYQYVTGYRSGQTARLALQRGEINFFAEPPPAYRGVVEAQHGEARRGDTGLFRSRPTTARRSRVEAGRRARSAAVPGASIAEDQRRAALRQAVGRLSHDASSLTSAMRTRWWCCRLAPPQAAVDALRTAVTRLNHDKAFAEEAIKVDRLRARISRPAPTPIARCGSALAVTPEMQGRSSPTTSRSAKQVGRTAHAVQCCYV